MAPLSSEEVAAHPAVVAAPATGAGEDEEKAAIKELIAIHPIARGKITKQVPTDEWRQMSGVEKLAFVKSKLNDDGVQQILKEHCDAHNVSDPHNVPGENLLSDMLNTAAEKEPGQCPWTAMMKGGGGDKQEAGAGGAEGEENAAAEREPGQCPWTAMMNGGGGGGKQEAGAGGEAAAEGEDGPRCPMTGKQGNCPVSAGHGADAKAGGAAAGTAGPRAGAHAECAVQ